MENKPELLDDDDNFVPGASFVPAVELDDTTLMRRHAKGNTAAFKTLYGRHKDALYRYLLRSSNSNDTAADLYHDVWLHIIKNPRDYKSTQRFIAYLFTVAHNRLTDYYRHKRITPVMATNAPAPIQEITNPNHSRHEQGQHLISAICALPFEQREVILLREEQGFSLDEIAKISGVERATAESRLSAALSKLRETPAHG